MSVSIRPPLRSSIPSSFFPTKAMTHRACAHSAHLLCRGLNLSFKFLHRWHIHLVSPLKWRDNRLPNVGGDCRGEAAPCVLGLSVPPEACSPCLYRSRRLNHDDFGLGDFLSFRVAAGSILGLRLGAPGGADASSDLGRREL